MAKPSPVQSRGESRAVPGELVRAGSEPMAIVAPGGGGLAPMGPDRAVAIAAAQSEAETELRVSVSLARQFPRNEDQVRQNILRACQRTSFAEKVCYRFPRGGSTVSGPSVYIMRELARMWGNLKFGFKITADDEDSRQIVCFAWDLETNSRRELPDLFQKLIQRKVGGGKTEWVRPDERDLRELTNRRAAFGYRECLRSMFPEDLIDDAVRTAAKTLESDAAQDPDATRKSIIDGFSRINVPVAQLELFIGSTLATCSPAQLEELRGVYRAISAGEATWSEFAARAGIGPQAADSELADAFGGASAHADKNPHREREQGDDRRRTTRTKDRPNVHGEGAGGKSQESSGKPAETRPEPAGKAPASEEPGGAYVPPPDGKEPAPPPRGDALAGEIARAGDELELAALASEVEELTCGPSLRDRLRAAVAERRAELLEIGNAAGAGEESQDEDNGPAVPDDDGALPKEVAAVVDIIANATNETGVLVAKQAWLAIRKNHPADLDELVNSRIAERMEELKR